MNATIAVALITALSTLCGVLIAGIITLKVNKAQGEQQTAVAKAEIDERKKAEQRAVRRQAYVQFLNRFDEVERGLMDGWKISPADDADSRRALGAVENNLSSLDGYRNIVSMEGPVRVAATAAVLRAMLWDEYHLLLDSRRRFRESKEHASEHVIEHLPKSRLQVERARSDFIDMASRALEQDSM
jgi:hypothetical protein